MERKRIEKLPYMHRNPVKRRLLLAPEQWQRSSFIASSLGLTDLGTSVTTGPEFNERTDVLCPARACQDQLVNYARPRMFGSLIKHERRGRSSSITCEARDRLRLWPRLTSTGRIGIVSRHRAGGFGFSERLS